LSKPKVFEVKEVDNKSGGSILEERQRECEKQSTREDLNERQETRSENVESKSRTTTSVVAIEEAIRNERAFKRDYLH
jgi:hypothetical protein